MMSYILQGSGAVLGPCLANLVSREMSKLTPCICLSCSRLVSSVPDRGKSPLRNFSQITSSSHNVQFSKLTPSNQPVMLRELSSTALTSSYRARYPKPVFRETHFTSYNVPMASPINVNLTFSVGPDFNTGVSHRFLHTSPLLDKKASSKIEETVIRLKEKQDEALADISKVQDLEKKIARVIEQEDMVSFSNNYLDKYFDKYKDI